MMALNATINDVAKAANVSTSTVSRVIANNPRISEATREKVSRVMEEMNYHPNMVARSLANRSTKIIGVVVPGNTEKAFEHPFYPQILSGISAAADKSDYRILLSTSVSNLKEEKKTINEFARSGITDGVILMTSMVHDSSIYELQRMNFPFVVVGRPANDEKINWVDNDNVSIARELTEHLIRQGCRKIAFIGLSRSYIVHLDRFEGYKAALKDNNIEFDENLVVEGEFMNDVGSEWLERFNEEGIKPDGIIASDDLIAFSIMKLLAKHNLKVPEDVAVGSFNNVPLSEFSSPTLTSVDVNAYGLGANAFELLFNCINSNYKSFNRAIIPAKIVARNSSIRKNASQSQPV